jgi:hypothetical protein
MRMIRLPRYGSVVPDGRKSEMFDYVQVASAPDADQLPAYEIHDQQR